MGKTKHSFDYFWNKIITRAITLCIKELDPSFQTKASVSMRKLLEYKIEIEMMYNQKDNWLKYEYRPEEQTLSLDMHKLSSILCRCVIGNKFFSYDTSTAELLQAERKLDVNISHDNQLDWEISNIYINYKLAFLVAEGVAFADLLYWAQQRINQDTEIIEQLKLQSEDSSEPENPNAGETGEIQRRLSYTQSFINILREEGRLRRYTCSSAHDDFGYSVIVSLMKSDCLQRDYDYFLMSAIMFQWQEYTKVRIFTDIIDNNIHIKENENITALLEAWLQ